MIKNEGKVPDLPLDTWVRVLFADGIIDEMQVEDGLPVPGMMFLTGNWWTGEDCVPNNVIREYEVIEAPH